jgi:hypothetical protein
MLVAVATTSEATTAPDLAMKHANKQLAKEGLDL